MEVWKRELEFMEQLAEIDQCKWTLLGLVYIYSRTDVNKAIKTLEKLPSVDVGRKRYYEDLGFLYCFFNDSR